MKLSRSSGILLHPTSLPGRFGVGEIGSEAFQFVDFLAETHQRLWQVLPLGPPGYGNCPYLSLSAFAGNPFLISPERLAEEKLLSPQDLSTVPLKNSLLKKSFQQFKTKGIRIEKGTFDDFCERHRIWLDDYALFMALRESQGGRPWTQWERKLARREKGALLEWGKRFPDEIAYYRYLQYQFFKQWSALKEYANGKGITIIGDLPIYVSHDSADIWSHPELFQLDETGNPLVVAGVPPDYFSKTGQLWGNPIYRWEVMAQTDYRWWIERFRTLSTLVDIVRLDHFRGFEAYWEVPASEKSAVNGRWVKGPGAAFFQTLQRALGDLPLIAEDLGVITPEVEALRDHFGLPGMKVLQFAFGGDPKDLPHRYPKHCAVYTGTHDNNTTVGWFWETGRSSTTQTQEELNAERARVLAYLKSDGRQIHWDFIRLALSSVAEIAILPMQDLLGLGSEARMNLPGRTEGNWRWRFAPGALTGKIRERLKELTLQYGRG